MFNIKIIKSESEHEIALARLMELMDVDPQEDSVEANEIEVLALLIEEYERQHYLMDPPDPIEAIKFRMDQSNFKNKDLITYIGSASKVSEVLSGKRSLSLKMIRKLSAGLGISADVLIREPVQHKVSSLEVDWDLFPVSEMKKYNYFPSFSGSLIELKEYAAEHIGKFFNQCDGFDLKPALLRSTAHLRSNEKTMDEYALWAWQAKVLQKVKSEHLDVDFIQGTVTKSWLEQLAKLSWSDTGPLLAKEYLNKSGIHLIFEPHLSKTYLDGAAFLDNSGRPVVALTLRQDKLDNFWFTLMHELSHVALHLNEGGNWYLDNLESEGLDDVENAADKMARDSLIPEAHWSASEISTVDDVLKLAHKLSISPSIVAGRSRFEDRNHQKFGTAFRDKVKHYFE